MIAFSPEEDERLLVDSARAFAQRWIRPHLRKYEAARAVPDEVRREFHGLGFATMEGVPLISRALLEEELAAADLGACVALDPLGRAADMLPKEMLAAFEQDPLRRAAFSSQGFALGGARAQLLVSDGAIYEKFEAVEERDPLGISELPLARVKPLGEGVPALAGSPRYLGINAARAVGCARASFEHARRYAEERTAFGKPIGHFQAIAFLLADMAIEIDGARLLNWKACRSGDDALLRQSAAHAREMLAFVTSNAVQILGGAGFVQDHPVEKWMRDARVLSVTGLC